MIITIKGYNNINYDSQYSNICKDKILEAYIKLVKEYSSYLLLSITSEYNYRAFIV